MSLRKTAVAVISTSILLLPPLLASAQATPPDFKGTIKLDVRDSTPDWGP